MTLMIDMDDVIVQGGFLALLNSYMGTNYTESDFKDFYMQDIVPDKRAFFDWFKDKNVYDYCYISPNCKEVIEELSKKYDVYIGTSYIYRDIPNECGYILEQKYNFLLKEFPFITTDKYIFITNKSLLQMDIKIDDRIDNLENAERKILFSAYHNETINDEYLKKMGIERAKDWLAIKEMLL